MRQPAMAITKQQKSTLMTAYGEDLAGAKNIVLVKQSGVSVNDSNALRMAVAEADGKLNVVRKRLFIRSLEKAGLQSVEHKDLDGAIVALYAHGDEFAPMKAVQKFVKDSKTAESKLVIEYVG
jgi:ribosomal protein L10